jgi:hypothetical protein
VDLGKPVPVDHFGQRVAVMARLHLVPPMNYEEVVKRVRRGAIAVSSAYLALNVLDVSVMTSSLPNIYVSDLAANCVTETWYDLPHTTLPRTDFQSCRVIDRRTLLWLDLRSKVDLCYRRRSEVTARALSTRFHLRSEFFPYFLHLRFRPTHDSGESCSPPCRFRQDACLPCLLDVVTALRCTAVWPHY